jgi:ABC-2 type transport system permease protein/lipopolysaccharide transport system permease protein
LAAIGYYDAVLDGPSSDLAVEGPANAPHPREMAASVHPREPRPEIWSHHRIKPLAALQELWHFRELTITLAERDLRVRYKQAALGIAWAVLTPVAMMIAFTLLFNRFAKVDTGGAPYALFSYLGLLPWTFFAASLSQGGESLIINHDLLNKLYCPREVFPIAAMAVAGADLAIATCVLAVLFPITGFAPKTTLYYLPLLLIVLLMFTLAVTLAVAAVVVYARDLRHVLTPAIQVGLFVTPVVYGASSISGSKAFLIAYSAINPLVPVIDGLRSVVLVGTPPNWASLSAGAASSLIYLAGAFVLFKRLEVGMADIA